MLSRRAAVLLRLPAAARLAPPSTALRHARDWPRRLLLSRPRRFYATPSRPKSVVGEPSRPVKRAAKSSAATATSSSRSPAKRKNDARKETAAKKKAAAAAKKKAAAAKKKAAAAKKKTGTKKVLTEKQKAAKAAKAEKEKIKALKDAALTPPKVTRASAYMIFTGEKMKEAVKGLSGGDRRKELGDTMKKVAEQWKQASSADVEHYNHLARTAKEDSEAEYKRWVASHSPEQIHTANLARRSLRRKLESEEKHKNAKTAWPLIEDERAAKRPVSAYFQFNINRQASGDFKNVPVAERSKLIAQEWKDLSEDEKHKYKVLQQEELKRYADEHTTVYGHPPSSFNGGHAQVHAAAAA